MAGSYAGGSTLVSFNWFAKSAPDFVLYRGDVGGPKGFRSFEAVEAYRALATRVGTLVKQLRAAKPDSEHQRRLAEIVTPLLDKLIQLEKGKDRDLCARLRTSAGMVVPKDQERPSITNRAATEARIAMRRAERQPGFATGPR
jgi:hypothetical protein